MGMIRMEEIEKYDACLKYLNVDDSVDTFARRIRIQKLAYLLEKLLGTRFVNDFNFYVRGPYSPSLALHYFYIKGRGTSSTGDAMLSQEEREELDRVLFVADLPPMQLEIMASLLWLRSEDGLGEDAAEDELKKRKPYLSMEDIWQGSQLLKRFMLRNRDAETLKEEIKEGLDEWDRASAEDFDGFSRNSGA